MQEVKAPHSYASTPRPWIFLAGSIELGGAEQWQSRVVQALESEPGTLLNPRRDAWDSSWRQDLSDHRFVEQVEWELEAQERADLIAMYFAPDTKAPITLLELGLFARSEKVIVCCAPGFWRKGNVDVVCRRYGVEQVATLDALTVRIREHIGRS